MVVEQRRMTAFARGACERARRALQCGSVDISMIAYLHHVGQRCGRAARNARLLTRVLFVAFRGLYRSWRAEGPAADPAFPKQRHAACRRLWIKLENVYWKLRESNTNAFALRALLCDVDAFLADSLRYMREADQPLLTRYVQSLHRLRGASVRRNESDIAIPRDSGGGLAPDMFATTDRLTEEAVDLRNRVLQKLRQTLSEH